MQENGMKGLSVKKIDVESEIFTQDGIKKIEEHYGAKYVCDGCVQHSEDGPWANFPVAFFYSEEPHPEFGNQYFAMYWHPIDNDLRICDGTLSVKTPISAVVADDGEVVYSRYRHDYRPSKDGSVWIDGGRDYVRSGLSESSRTVTLKIVDGVLITEDLE